MIRRPILYSIFFASGATALVYEIAWQKMLAAVLGVSLYAVAVITATFLGGLALGALLSATQVSRIGNRSLALKLYATLEIGVGIGAMAVPFLFSGRVLESLLASLEAFPDPSAQVLRLLMSVAAILLPTIMMGATLPVLIHAMVATGDEAKQESESLYAINLAGAVVGCLVTGIWLLPQIGIIHACFTAAVVNVAIGVCAYALSFGVSDLGVSTTSDALGDSINASVLPAGGEANSTAMGGAARKKAESEQTLTLSDAALAAFCAGMISLSLEVCWTRWFQLLSGSSPYTFTIVLGLFLLGTALGAIFASAVLRKLKQPMLVISAASAVSVIYLIVMLYAAEEMPWLLVLFTQSLAKASPVVGVQVPLLARLMLAALNVFIPCVCLGVIVPLLFDCIASKQASARTAGLIYGANTIGTIFGACFSAFVLVPTFSAIATSGIQWTMIVVILGQSAFSFWLFTAWSKTFISDTETRWIVNGIVAFLAVAVIGDVVFFRPAWSPSLMASGAGFYMPSELGHLDRDVFFAARGQSRGNQSIKPLPYYREGLNSVVSVESMPGKNLVILKNDGKTEAALPANPERAAPGTDIATHAMLGAIPVLLHNGACDQVLVIGYGSGVTSGAVAAFPEVRHLKICELEPAVIDAGKFFDGANGQPLRSSWRDSGRVTVIHNDGRYVLSSGRSLYDVVISQPADPWVSGSSSLFTEQFWQLGRKRLKPDGIFCQWIQLYSLEPEYFGVLCRTFMQAFPDSILIHRQGAGECLLVGFNGQSTRAPEEIVRRLKSAFAEQRVLQLGGLTEASDVLSDVRLNAPALTKMCAAIGQETHDMRINTDDNMIVEYAAAQNSLTQQQNIDANVGWIKNFIQ